MNISLEISNKENRIPVKRSLPEKERFVQAYVLAKIRADAAEREYNEANYSRDTTNNYFLCLKDLKAKLEEISDFPEEELRLFFELRKTEREKIRSQAVMVLGQIQGKSEFQEYVGKFRRMSSRLNAGGTIHRRYSANPFKWWKEKKQVKEYETFCDSMAEKILKDNINNPLATKELAILLVKEAIRKSGS